MTHVWTAKRFWLSTHARVFLRDYDACVDSQTLLAVHMRHNRVGKRSSIFYARQKRVCVDRPLRPFHTAASRHMEATRQKTLSIEIHSNFVILFTRRATRQNDKALRRFHAMRQKERFWSTFFRLSSRDKYSMSQSQYSIYRSPGRALGIRIHRTHMTTWMKPHL